MLRSKLGNKYPTWKYFIVKKCIALRLCLLNRSNAQGCARSKRKACVSESSDGEDKYRKGDSTGGDKKSRRERGKEIVTVPFTSQGQLFHFRTCISFIILSIN